MIFKELASCGTFAEKKKPGQAPLRSEITEKPTHPESVDRVAADDTVISIDSARTKEFGPR